LLRSQSLTTNIIVGLLTGDPGILRGQAYGLRALLEQRRVVDHQDRVWTAHEPVGMGQKFGFERGVVLRSRVTK
jgi:hypothetical protein